MSDISEALRHLASLDDADESIAAIELEAADEIDRLIRLLNDEREMNENLLYALQQEQKDNVRLKDALMDNLSMIHDWWLERKISSQMLARFYDQHPDEVI